MASASTLGPRCNIAALRARPCQRTLAGVLLLVACAVSAIEMDKPALVDLAPPADSVLASSGPWMRISPTPVGPLAAGWQRPGTPAGVMLVVGLPLGQLGPFGQPGRLGELRLQAPLAPPPTVPGLDNPQRELRVSLALTARDPYADLRRGMLTRIELSGQTTVSLRPRGGKVMLHLTSRW